MLLETVEVEKQKPHKSGIPEILIGEESREAFLEKLESAIESENSVICVSTMQDSLNVVRRKKPKEKELVCYIPGEPEKSQSFNWMPLYKDNNNASEFLLSHLARTIINADYKYNYSLAIYHYGITELKQIFTLGFGEKEEQLYVDHGGYFLQALFRYVAEQMPNPTPVKAYDYLNNFLDNHNKKQLLDILANSENKRIKELITLFTTLDEETCFGLMSRVSAALYFLFRQETRDFTSDSTQAPDFAKLRKENLCVSLSLDEYHLAEKRGLSSLFCNLAIEQLKKARNGKTVYFFIDDITKVGHMLNLALEVQIIRACNIGLVLFAPSMQELEKVYGRTEDNKCGWQTSSILANCLTAKSLSLSKKLTQLSKNTLESEYLIKVRQKRILEILAMSSVAINQIEMVNRSNGLIDIETLPLYLKDLEDENLIISHSKEPTFQTVEPKPLYQVTDVGKYYLRILLNNMA